MSNSPKAELLRGRIVFTIVPCLNPDGVIMGNYRTGFSGEDLNRQFEEPNSTLHPTVAAIKNLISRLLKTSTVLAYFDLHAHSKKKSVFFYGPHYPLHSEKYYSMRVLPKVICDQGQEFRFSACRFGNEASKQRAARLVNSRQFGITNCYTVETSSYGYLTEERKTKGFEEESLQEVGENIGKGLADYIVMMDEEVKLIDEKRRLRKKRYSKTLQRDSSASPPSRKQSSLPSLDSVITSIKAAEVAPSTPEPGDLSDTSSEGELLEDQLSLHDRQQLHEEITSIMQECNTIASQASARKHSGAKQSNKTRISRVTPEFLRIGDEPEKSKTPLRPEKRDYKEVKQVQMSPLFLTEAKAAVPTANCRRKLRTLDYGNTRKVSSKSPLLMDTRRTKSRFCKDLSEERSADSRSQPRSISPIPAPRNDEEIDSPLLHSLITTKRSPLIRSEAKSSRTRIPVTRPVSILPHIPTLKTRPMLNLSRKLSQIFAKAKIMSSECS